MGFRIAMSATPEPLFEGRGPPVAAHPIRPPVTREPRPANNRTLPDIPLYVASPQVLMERPGAAVVPDSQNSQDKDAWLRYIWCKAFARERLGGRGQWSGWCAVPRQVRHRDALLRKPCTKCISAMHLCLGYF